MNILDPLFNRDKIGGGTIINVEIDKKENSDINHKARHVIKLTKDWIKRPFKLDSISQAVVFHATTHPTRGRGAKVIVHQLDREVEYYRAQKCKGKRKRTSPKQAKPKEEPTQAPTQEGENNV